MLHLHPLRSRVMDMDHKLRVAMDNLIRKVKVASSSRPPPGELVSYRMQFSITLTNRMSKTVCMSPRCLFLSSPDATPDMLQYGHSLIMSTLDFLMVAQCASLVHKVAIAGWELMQFPWVRAIAGE